MAEASKDQIDAARAALKSGPGFGVMVGGTVSRWDDLHAPCHAHMLYGKNGHTIHNADVVWSSAHSISVPTGGRGNGRNPASDTPATRAWYEWIASKDSPWHELELWEHNSDPEYVRTQGWIITNFKGKLPLLYNFLIGQRLAYEFPHHCERWWSWVAEGVNPSVALAWLTVPLDDAVSAYGLGGHSCFDGILVDVKPFIEGKPQYRAADGLTPCNVIWGAYGGRYCYVTNKTPTSKMAWPKFEKTFTKTRTVLPPFGTTYSTKTELDPADIVAFLIKLQKEEYGL